jgi:hypothetical protein
MTIFIDFWHFWNLHLAEIINRKGFLFAYSYSGDPTERENIARAYCHIFWDTLMQSCKRSEIRKNIIFCTLSFSWYRRIIKTWCKQNWCSFDYFRRFRLHVVLTTFISHPIRNCSVRYTRLRRFLSFSF